MAKEDIEQKYTVTIEYHGTKFTHPWVVRRESLKPNVVGGKSSVYDVPEEALKEAVRFLTSSLKLEDQIKPKYSHPKDSPIFKNTIDWLQCAECERNTCDGCGNMKQPESKALDCNGCKYNDARILDGKLSRPCDFCDFERTQYTPKS